MRRGDVSADSRASPRSHGLPDSSFRGQCHIVSSAAAGMRSSLRNRRVPRAPLPGRRQSDLADRLRGRYPSFVARTGSCARPPRSSSLGSPRRRVVAGCRQPRLKGGPSRQYPCSPCVGAWTHTPPCLSGARTRSFPDSSGLAPVETCSAHGMLPAQQLLQEAGLRSCSHSLMFRLPRSLGPQIAPTASRYA